MTTTSAVLGLLLGSVVPQQPPDYTDGVWLSLEGEPESHGLALIDTSFGDDTATPTEIGGRKCHVVGVGQAWFRLRVDPAFLFGAKELDVTLEIEYYDNGPGPIQFAYDCADSRRLVGGMWATEFPRCRTGIEEWRTLRLCLARAAFRKRQNGADLGVGRHRGPPPQHLHLARIRITRAFLDIESTPPAICLDDGSSADLTITARGPDGGPAPDGTKVQLYCEQGTVPATLETKAGSCRAKVTVEGACGEARIEVRSPWSTREFRLPVLEGGGGVVEVRYPLVDFEDYAAGDKALLEKRPGGAEVSGTIIGERAHEGDIALRVDYAFPDDVGDATLPVHQQVPGYTRGFEAYGISQRDWPEELRFSVEDCTGEVFVFAGQLPQKGDEWLRYWVPLLDPLMPGQGGDGNQRLDQPLFLCETSVTARGSHKLAPGSIDLDDIGAIIWLSKSEVPEEATVIRQVHPQ